MTTPDKTTHWKSLAELLGAAPQEETQTSPPEAGSSPAFSATPTSAVQPPPPPPPPPAPPRPAPAPPARKTRSDWKSLASILGLGGKTQEEELEEVQQPQPTEAREEPRYAEDPLPSREVEEREEPVVRETDYSEPVELAASPWDSAAETDELIDPLEMTAEPFVDEVADAVDLDVPLESDAEKDSVAEERHRRRRRRRRRGRRSEEPVEQSERRDREESPVADSTPEHEEIPFAEFVEEQPEETEATESHIGDSAEPSEDRPRRRRRRRRRGGRREETTSQEKAASPAPVEEEEPGDEEDTLAELLGEDDGDDEGKGDEPHLSHKKIPSWQEAIEVVISTNMAQRSKYPSSSQRGRGRRDRDR